MFSYTRKHAPLRVLVALTIVSALLIGSFSALAQPSANVSIKAANQALSQPQVSTNMVINEIQTGSNVAGDEFIELYNRGNTSYDLNGHRVVYRSAAGSTDSAVFAVFTTTQIIPAGGYFLICSTTYSNQAICDSTYSSGGMAAAGGGVALRNGPNDTGAVIDSLGYGTATNAFIEGTRAAAPPNTNPAQSLARIPNGSDSDNNSLDFSVATTPTPKASNSPSVSPTATATAAATNTPGGPTSTATATAAPPTNTVTASPTPSAGLLRIRDIQGASHLSPYSGTLVSNVPGIVTVKRNNGFYLQDPSPDANDATSEAVFVFTSSAPSVNVGDSVLVSGTVKEFRATSCSSNGLTTTEIDNPGRLITVISSGNPLPAPITIGIGGRVPPNQIIEDDASGDVETSGTFDPASDGIDFYESMEAMRIQINNPVVTGPTSDFGSNREIATLADNGANAGLRTPRGGIIIQPTDFNPERIILNDVILRYIGGGTLPLANVSDQFSGSLVGVMDYSFCNFKFQITQALPTFISGNLQREVTIDRTADQVSIATFNMENLAPTDPITKFNTLASLIVNNLKAPDIISAEEIQDNSGAVDDGTVDASLTYSKIISAVVAAGGPTYDYRQINPVNNQDGGQPGGNIRQGFMFRTDRGVSFVDRPGGGSTITTTVQPGPNGPELSYSPGRVAPNDPAWSSSRKPLAAEFMFNGQHLFVIGNHFNSKGGDQPLFGHWQPPTRSSEVQRAQQATLVHDFSAQILALDPAAKIVVLGDMNDFWFSNTLNILKGTPQILNNLIETLPLNERYTYVFEGNTQDLDQVLASNALFSVLALADPLHVNAEFADQASDHDPNLALFNLPASTPTPQPTATATPAPPTATRTSTPLPPTNTATSLPPTLTPTATPNLIDQIIGSTVLTQDLQLSSVLGVGSLNTTISGQTFGTGGYLLFNYDGNTSFVGCNPPGTPCPPSPNSNDRTLLSAPFSGVNISITRASGISNPITQTQSGGSAFIDNGPHKFSGIYDIGPNGNGQTLIITLTNLPTTPFRLTVYNNNNPGGGSRSGTIIVTNGGGNPAQLLNYNEGGGAVTQWLLSGTSSVTVIQTNQSSAGNAPVGGILFDNDTTNPTPTLTVLPTTPTATNVPPTNTTTATPGAGTPTATPGSATATATNVPPTATATSVSSTATSTPTSGTPSPATPTSTTIPTTSTPMMTRTGTPVMTVTTTATPAMTGTATMVATNTPIPPQPTATTCPNPFVDINGNVFYNAIVYLYCRGVVNGVDSTHYGPAGTSTRAQFAKVVVLGFAIPAFTPNGGTSTFTDVPNSYFAYQYIETGYAAGILSGFDSATCAAIGATYPCYGPNRPITRAQLTKLVVAAGGFSLFTPTSGQTFSDVGRSNVFFTYIETAARYGIVGGYPDNTFRPNNNIRRDEMAQIVYKGITTPPLRLVECCRGA